MNADSRLMILPTVALALALSLAARTVDAATIVINNVNAAGVGFNDSATPDPSAGCDGGETIGDCRLRVFTQAADQWGALLQSPVTITINGSMTALTCTTNSATLGQAGPLSLHADFANAPRAGTAYVQAEANSLAGTDLSGSNDIQAQFNVSIDAGCLGGVSGWWYSTDPGIAVPNDRTPLLPVVFHEIGHGLGFTSLYDSSGNAYSAPSVPVWGYYLVDTSTMKTFKDMTSGERVAASIDDPNLVWAGPLTSEWAQKILGNPVSAIINSPAGIAGAYPAQAAAFGPGVDTNPVTADVVLVDDGTGTTSDGCELPFVNASSLPGKIALIDRGSCNFTVKVKNAQDAGAVGVLVANNVASGLSPMGGSDPTITIPSLGTSQALGTSIKANLPGVNASLALDLNSLAGTDSGCVRMYAPNPFEGGSSVSHFSKDAFPNLLMEPALNRTIFDKVDLTLPLFRDIGWKTGFQDIMFLGTFDPNPCTFVQP
ncbi:MAG: PA domain-containing protein [Rhodanobacteraceae bacterium]